MKYLTATVVILVLMMVARMWHIWTRSGRR